ncbi:hypothetical protein O0I10_007623 [Lichtheimia ornata]|uniref:Uncharacterized protein n=1 Tax=Lichtheimia ornata TaxID=688661 RepID=A0AAD7V1Y9_9FUNG|nr:uncharacterized protein O0I10_007623 [Lichtheimia ornata]KAJ8656775.1 hypothetical protein O0I10_007623 [Lichtheimia ornata]
MTNFYFYFAVIITMLLVFQQATCALDRDFCKAYDKDKAACEHAGCQMRPYARYGLVPMYGCLAPPQS